MLLFKGRPRKSPNLAEKITPSQRRIMRLLADARESVQQSLNLDDLARDIDRLPAGTVANRITTEPWIAMQQDLADELYTEYVDAGRRVKVPQRAVLKQNTTLDLAMMGYGYVPLIGFDATRTQARDWADKEAGNLIVQISDEQREVVRELILKSTEGTYTVSQIARQVRGSIGLTEQQAGWVENFRQRKIDEARDRGVPAEQAADAVQADVDKYHARIHRYRSETIARTETIRASSEGRQAAWQQGIDDGFISPYAQKRWVVEFDGCKICQGNGDLGPIPLQHEFPTGEPPAHPNCRCDVILVDDEIDADLLEMTDEELAAEIESLIEAGPATPAPIPEPGEAGGLPKWARDRGIDSLLAELPEDRSQIGYRTESEADAIRRWENDHSDWADDIEVIRREGREADERLPAVDSLREKVDANRRKMEELVAGEQKMTAEELHEYTRLAQEAHDLEDEIRDTEFKVRRRDEAEATIARQKEKITDWRDTLEARTIVDIDEVSGKPGPALRRQLEIVQEVGSAVEAEVQSRLPERLRGVAARRIALGEIDEEDLRTITETREQVLAEIRPMDEGQDNFKGATSDEAMTRNRRTGANYPGANLVYAANEGTMGAVGRALDVYPTAWIERMGDDQGEITVMRADRGFSDTRAPLISVSGETPERKLAVAVHEVGHRMQISTPGLRILEWALLRSRTVGDGPPPLAQISDAPEGEKHLIGSTFRHSYTARIYEKASESTIKLMSSPMGQQRVSFEVFPTGTQATFPRSKADVAFADLDGSFQDWTLGVLASL